MKTAGAIFLVLVMASATFLMGMGEREIRTEEAGYEALIEKGLNIPEDQEAIYSALLIAGRIEPGMKVEDLLLLRDGPMIPYQMDIRHWSTEDANKVQDEVFLYFGKSTVLRLLTIAYFVGETDIRERLPSGEVFFLEETEDYGQYRVINRVELYVAEPPRVSKIFKLPQPMVYIHCVTINMEETAAMGAQNTKVIEQMEIGRDFHTRGYRMRMD